jgi:predicted Zn-ribbon and HTH transcriptional regulator
MASKAIRKQPQHSISLYIIHTPRCWACEFSFQGAPVLGNRAKSPRGPRVLGHRVESPRCPRVYSHRIESPRSPRVLGPRAIGSSLEHALHHYMHANVAVVSSIRCIRMVSNVIFVSSIRMVSTVVFVSRIRMLSKHSL